MAETWDVTFEALPTNTEDASLGDDRIRSTKLAIRERITKEHFFDPAEAGTQPRQGLHRAGSAVSFIQAAAPTTRNGVALTSADNGLLWVDTDDMLLYIYQDPNWVSVVARSTIALAAPASPVDGDIWIV